MSQKKQTSFIFAVLNVCDTVALKTLHCSPSTPVSIILKSLLP